MLIQMKFSKNSRIEENSCMDVKKTAHPLGGLYNKFSPKKRNKSNSDDAVAFTHLTLPTNREV